MMPFIDLGWMRLYTYPVMVGFAWGLGINLTRWMLEKFQVSWKGYGFSLLGIFLSAWIGAKIVFLMALPSVSTGPLTVPPQFWLGGGFVFYGGLFGAALFCLTHNFFFHGPDLAIYRFCLPGLCLSHALGRVGCFLAGCCYGRPSDLPWATSLHGEFRHPVQLYEFFFLILLGGFLYFLLTKKALANKVIIFYFLGYALIRFFLEFFRGDPLRGIPMGNLSTSQWVSLGIFVVIALMAVRQIWEKGGKKQGGGIEL